MPTLIGPGQLARFLVLPLLALLALTGCGDAADDAATVGDQAPGFDLPEASGSTVSLTDYAGTPILLYFHMADG